MRFKNTAFLTNRIFQGNIPKMIREHSFRRIPASKRRSENKITDLGKMIQWIKTLDEKLKGNFTMEALDTDRPPDRTQYKKQGISYVELLPKRLNLNLLKSLQLTSLARKMGNMVTNDTTGSKQT